MRTALQHTVIIHVFENNKLYTQVCRSDREVKEFRDSFTGVPHEEISHRFEHGDKLLGLTTENYKGEDDDTY